jgi:hypothetical protein
MTKKRSTNLLVLSAFFIIASLIFSTTPVSTVYKAIPAAYAQTNAATLAVAVAANGNGIGIGNNSITNTNKTTSNEGLQIKKDIKYFDNSSGYLVYPSTAATTNATDAAMGKKLPAVIMIHENRGLNEVWQIPLPSRLGMSYSQ